MKSSRSAVSGRSFSRRTFIALAGTSATTAVLAGNLLSSSSHASIGVTASGIGLSKYRHPLEGDWFIPARGEWGNVDYPREAPNAGVDYAINGTAPAPVIAIESGTAFVGQDESHGYQVFVKHEDGLWSHYSNLGAKPPLSNGTRVRGGDHIGQTGAASDDRHVTRVNLAIARSQAGCITYSDTIDPLALIGVTKLAGIGRVGG